MTVADNSTTNGYLRPVTPDPLEGDGLNDFLQAWIVGITGLSADLVRPAWQPEPPSPPDAGTVWAAFGINNTDADTFPYVVHDPAGDGTDTIMRHERMDMLVSFYGLGSGSDADKYARLLRDGSAIEQNAQQLRPGNMALVKVGDLLTVPSLIKQRWLYRVDLPIRIAREIDQTYAVVSVTSMTGELVTDVGLPPRPLTVDRP